MIQWHDSRTLGQDTGFAKGIIKDPFSYLKPALDMPILKTIYFKNPFNTQREWLKQLFQLPRPLLAFCGERIEVLISGDQCIDACAVIRNRDLAFEREGLRGKLLNHTVRRHLENFRGISHLILPLKRNT